MREETYPFVSVIVPVLNQLERLAMCLAALQNQSYPKSRFEVIVIDNGSKGSVAAMVTNYPQARLIHERCPSSYAARNKGIRVAKGMILAFTDADCIPEPAWIERGVGKLLSLSGDGVIGGRVDLFYTDPDSLTAVEMYESIVAFPQKTYIEHWGFSGAGNLFTFATTMEKVGLFDATLKSSGDLDWGQRVRARGFAQVYADDVRVRHPARRSLGELCRKTARVAGGLHDLSRKQRIPLPRILKQILDDLIPIRRIFQHISDKRLSTFSQKLEFAAVAWFVGIVRALERLRIQFGGESRRV